MLLDMQKVFDRTLRYITILTTATKQLQIHADILQPYSSIRKLTINADKTEIINFRRKFTSTEIYQDIKINNSDIKPKSFVRYLEAILGKKLKYLKYIETAVRKGYIALRHLYPLMISDTLTKSPKVLIYKMLVRPTITYAAPDWCGRAQTNLRKLQIFVI